MSVSGGLGEGGGKVTSPLGRGTVALSSDDNMGIPFRESFKISLFNFSF